MPVLYTPLSHPRRGSPASLQCFIPLLLLVPLTVGLCFLACHCTEKDLQRLQREAAADLSDCRGLLAEAQQPRAITVSPPPPPPPPPLPSPEVSYRETLLEERFMSTGVALQRQSLQLLRAEFGLAKRRLVELRLRLPGASAAEPVLFEMAPDEVMPTAVLYYLRQVQDGVWNGGVFHRNAGHVLQGGPGPNRRKFQQAADARGDVSTSIPFQEYSPAFPHEQYTVGLAGRPGGPDMYVSMRDNTRNHGPGSQNSDAKLIGEADSCFAKVVGGLPTLKRMLELPVLPGGYRRLKEMVVIESAKLLTEGARETVAKAAAAATAEYPSLDALARGEA